MKKESSTMAFRFYEYQKKRFPIIILALCLFPAILSSGAVVSSHLNIITVFLALIAALAYLLHIRVIDECRDFGHDSVHHADRPVQVGLISKEELKKIDFISIIILFGIAFTFGKYVIFFSILMWCYSYLAEKEFFLKKVIHRNFFIYNGINLVQMLLMQIFVYLVFSTTISLNALLISHFLFTTIGSLTFEFVRKVKIPGDDGTGKDTYTWYLGFRNALVLYVMVSCVAFSLFLRITALISKEPFMWLVLIGVLAVLMVGVAIVHWMKRTKNTDQLLQLVFPLCYGILNMVIYFIND